jgi:hypothetical protein
LAAGPDRGEERGAGAEVVDTVRMRAEEEEASEGGVVVLVLGVEAGLVNLLGVLPSVLAGVVVEVLFGLGLLVGVDTVGVVDVVVAGLGFTVEPLVLTGLVGLLVELVGVVASLGGVLGLRGGPVGPGSTALPGASPW